MFDGDKVYRQEALEPVPTSDYHRSENGILRQRSRDTPVLRRQIMEDTGRKIIHPEEILDVMGEITYPSPPPAI